MKKAQIRMFETIAVIFVLFFLIGFGLIYYSRFYMSGIEERQIRNFELRAIETAQKVSFLPELRCSSNNILKDNCFDIVKIRKFKDLLSENPRLIGDYYYDIFGYSTVTIKQVYSSDPEQQHLASYTIYDYRPNEISSRSSFQMPVLLYFPLSRRTEFGVIYIDYYQDVQS